MYIYVYLYTYFIHMFIHILYFNMFIFLYKKHQNFNFFSSYRDDFSRTIFRLGSEADLEYL